MAGLIPGKLLYLRSPHTASVATEQAILRVHPEAMTIIPGHCTLEDIEGRRATSKDGEIQAADLLTGDELVVTTVRNPYDVIVTWWIRAGKKVPFAQFIREYDRAPQVIDGRIFSRVDRCDVVMRYESLVHDWTALLASLRLSFVPIPVENTTAGKGRWRSYYNDEALDAVDGRFGSEIESLGYELARSSTTV